MTKLNVVKLKLREVEMLDRNDRKAEHFRNQEFKQWFQILVKEKKKDIKPEENAKGLSEQFLSHLHF